MIATNIAFSGFDLIATNIAFSGFDLIANDVRPEDSGVYQCKAFSSVLAVYRTQVLCVVRKFPLC